MEKLARFNLKGSGRWRDCNSNGVFRSALNAKNSKAFLMRTERCAGLRKVRLIMGRQGSNFMFCA